ncbi:manno-octulosonate cytidylyltransferase [Litorimonas sp. RW-G-Af-16]|uniref:3-deoxy-manno-octulosonate cytidylyltransferase family protein n=1 Tax=Litorimonas sp. RW-G-Af-16 TaxID=3241168 RepID=UPI00390C5E91
MYKQSIIVIPARMGSTRFPGKPLAKIAGVSMVRRTADIANQTGQPFVIATDHADIVAHCEEFGLPCVITDANLRTGSDRALVAAKAVAPDAQIIVNLQGDAPFTPVAHLQAVIEALHESDDDIATPYVQLGWVALDQLRQDKLTTPFSGTTLITDLDERAVWFSKTIIPTIRNEAALRAAQPLSPVRRHVGLYAFRKPALERFVGLAESRYELLEGLEQLRAIENGLTIKAVAVDPPDVATPGIDTPDDLRRAEALIRKHGDPFKGH